MAVERKANETYLAIKARVEKWGPSTLYLPTFLLPILLFIGFIVGDWLYPTKGAGYGFLIGGILTCTFSLIFTKRKLGFILWSDQSCQACEKPLAEWRGFHYRAFNICPNCGNDNRIDLNDA